MLELYIHILSSINNIIWKQCTFATFPAVFRLPCTYTRPINWKSAITIKPFKLFVLTKNREMNTSWIKE